MNLDEMKEKLADDLKINQTDLQYEAAQHPIKHSFYINQLSAYKRLEKVLRNEVTEVKFDRYMYYAGKHAKDFCPEVYEKSEIKVALEADPKVIEANTKHHNCVVVIEWLKDTCDLMRHRGYAIKNCIEMLRFNAGVN